MKRTTPYVTGIFLALIGAVVADVGWKPALILMFAGIGLMVTTVAVMGVSGYNVVAHAKQEQQSIESARPKELTR